MFEAAVYELKSSTYAPRLDPTDRYVGMFVTSVQLQLCGGSAT
jgi:hypothetical protein